MKWLIPFAFAIACTQAMPDLAIAQRPSTAQPALKETRHTAENQAGQVPQRAVYVVWVHNGKKKFEYRRTFSYQQAVQWRDYLRLYPNHWAWIVPRS